MQTNHGRAKLETGSAAGFPPHPRCVRRGNETQFGVASVSIGERTRGEQWTDRDVDGMAKDGFEGTLRYLPNDGIASSQAGLSVPELEAILPWP